MQTRINVRKCVWVLAVVLGTATTGGALRVAAHPSSQERHEEDYLKNKNYRQGMRDGKDDQAHDRDHYKKRHFKKDEDRKAYEYGYQQGHQGDQHDHESERRDHR